MLRCMTIDRKILALKTSYLALHERTPNVVTISNCDEYEFLDILATFPDEIGRKMFVEGPRGALTEIFGMRIAWGATETSVGLA